MILYEILEGFKIAAQAITSNKLRAVLTTLGVVIGITFVILTGWMLKGLDAALDQTISLIGTDIVYVDKYDWAGGRRWSETRNRKDVTYEQAEKLIERLSTAQLAVPSVRRWSNTVKYGSQYLEGITIIGTTSEYSGIAVGNIEQGRFFSPLEDTYRTYVAVLAYNVTQTLFPNGDAIGQTIKIKGVPFTVIGTIEKQGTLLMDFIDNQIYIPLRVFFSMYGSDRSITVAVRAGSEERLPEVRLETIGLMRQIRNLRPDEDIDFSLNESKAFRDSIAQIRLTVWGVGIGMTVLSFIVGIIGIMNIMFVSVTERTKEIGIRKALGARQRSILLQFLLESAALCFTGALFAFVLCSVLIFAGTMFIEQASFLSPYIPPDLLGIAALVSFIVGILAGMIPAIRAARMDPVEALRKE
jgi:putative ABC transport system permease protein